jgi:hypothetical protein
MRNENIKGGVLIKSNREKSVINKLVNIGWSIRPVRIFLNITIQTNALN